MRRGIGLVLANLDHRVQRAASSGAAFARGKVICGDDLHQGHQFSLISAPKGCRRGRAGRRQDH